MQLIQSLNILILYKKLKTSSFFINLFSVTGSNIISKLISIITLGYVARVLGPENYGIYAFGLSIFAYIGIILFPGMVTWGNREIARNKKNAESILFIVIVTRFILSLLGFTSVFIFSYYFLEGIQKWVVILCCLALFSNAFQLDWVLNGLEYMRIPAYLGILSSILNVISLFTIIRSPEDIYYLPLITVVISIIISIILFLILIIKFKLNVKISNWINWKTAIIRAIPLSIMSTLIVILHYTNNIIIKAYVGNEALGVFYSAYKLIEYAGMLPGILMIVFLPRLSRLVIENKEKASKEALLMARVHMFIAFFIGTIFFMEAEKIINLIYGEKFINSIIILKIMSIAVIFNYAIIGYTNCLISFGKDDVMIMVVIVSTIISVGGGLLLVPKLGALGGAIVIMLVDLSGWIVSLPYYKKTIGSLQLKSWKMPIFACIIMSIFIYIMKINNIPFCLRIPISLIIFFSFSLLNIKEILNNAR